MLKSNAGRNPTTSNPSITELESRMSKAFITKVNKPSVIMVIGNVIMTSIGLIKIFTNPIKIESQIAAHTPRISTPVINFAAKRIDTTKIIHFIK